MKPEVCYVGEFKMNLQSLLYNFYRKISYVNSFINAAKNPVKAQEKVLRSIISKNKDTEFGKEHYFSSIKSVEDFQEKVPVRNYEQFAPYIEKIKAGTQNVLTKEPVVMFATTSGTTATPKFCPATHESIRLYARNFQIFFYFAQRDHPRMFERQVLSIVSQAVKGATKSGIPFGAISGLIYRTEPFYVKEHYGIPEAVFTIQDYEARYYCILRFAIEKDISFIITPNPSTILLLCELAIKYKSKLIDDIEHGTLSTEFMVEPAIRKMLESSLRKNPERAAFLKMLEQHKRFMPKFYWPHIALIACWKEGTLGHYIRQLERHFDKLPIRDLGLIASEAHCSIPVSDTVNAGILTIDTNFFEFIDVKDRKIVTVADIELNKEYSLILTTSAGLYRYQLHDIVKVVGYYHKTPLIQFIHRGNHSTSITGEKLTEWQAVTAVKQSWEKYSIPFKHFTFYAHGLGKGHYDLYMELDGSVHQNVLRLFLKEVDTKLMQFNIEYRDKRKSGRLLAPRLKIVEQHAYQRMHRTRSIIYGQDAQIKLPVLTDEKKFKEGMKVIQKITL